MKGIELTDYLEGAGMPGVIRTWDEYARLALTKKCYAPAHELTYPLISLQTELSELHEALQKVVARVKHPFPGLNPQQCLPQVWAHAQEELGDVLWAFTALTWAMNWCHNKGKTELSFSSRELQDFWNVKFAELENAALLDMTVHVCKLKTAVPVIYTQLNLVADRICRSLRMPEAGVEWLPCPAVNSNLLRIGKDLVKITKALNTTLECTMNRQLSKMDDREKAGKFVVLTSIDTK